MRPEKRTLGINTAAYGINDRNQIFGNVTDANNQTVGFGPGCDFNRGGAVAANGMDLRTGVTHVYVLTPRPDASAGQ